MGGKQKQAQRTKNNARPSSSSRSAEKLGANVSTFVGFSANKDGGYNAVLPGFSSVENFDAIIDPNVQMVFRKMCKKDPVTKLKALSEFSTFIKTVDEETLCTTLSFWPRIYSQLSSDSNHRVREVTQITHGALVTKCGRSIAPYLKQLIPIWLTSQYDTYMPAKVQAKESFEKVFPPNKIPEVLAFCRNEIIDYISENLIVHTSITLSNPKIFNAEECETIYERTVVMSLQGYIYFLNNLPDEHLDWLNERQEKILDNNRFWDLGKQKSSLVRSSLYAVIGCFCRRVNKWFTPKYGKKACIFLFSQLNQKDYDLLISVWENVILLMAYIQDWWSYIDIENDILIHVYNVFIDGGRNCATGIGPLMLPLLVHLSTVKKESINTFHEKFLSSICSGLEQRSVISSKSNTNSWLIGMVECLSHIANINVESEEYSHVLSQSIRSWINVVIEPKTFSSSFNFVKLNSSHLAILCLSWTKESLASGARGDKFSHLIRIFWKNFLYALTTQIENMKSDETEIKKITENHIELMMGLKNSNNHKRKLSSHVKFEIDVNISDNNLVAAKMETIQNQDIVQNFLHSLNNVANEICGHYLLCARSKNISSPILSPLFSLVCEFDSFELQSCMLRATSKDHSEIINLYINYYEKWLKSDSMRSQAVVDLSFSLMTHLNSDEQMYILKSFNQLPLPVTKWCISRCLAHPYSKLPAVMDWLQSNTVHESLIALSKLVVKQGDRNHMELLKMCFIQSDFGNILISQNTCCSIISIFGKSLHELDSDHLNICAMFASHLASSLSTYLNECETYVDLLISLFTLNCDIQKCKNKLTEDVLHEMNSSWRDALLTLTDDCFHSFIKKSQTIILNKLLKSENISEHLQIIDALVDLSLNIIDSCSNKISSDNMAYSYSILLSLLNVENDEIKTIIKKTTSLSLLTDIINGKLCCSSDSTVLYKFIENGVQQSMDLNVNELVMVLSWLLYSVKILNFVLDFKNECENLNLICKPDSCDIVLNVFYHVALFKTLAVEYKAWSWYGDFLILYDPLTKISAELINHLTDSNYDQFHELITRKHQSEGYYWTVCLYMCERNMKISRAVTSHSSEIDQILNNFVDKLDADNFRDLLSIEFYHNLQVLKSEGHIMDSDEFNMKIMCVLAMRSVYITHFLNNENKLDICFDLNEFKCGISSPLISLTTIIDLYYAHKEILLYNEDISSVNWDIVNCNTSIIRFLSSCVNVTAWELDSHHWDFIMVSLSYFIQSLDKSKKEWDSPKITLFASAVFELFCSVSKFISSILPMSISKEPTKALLELLDESRDLFAPDMHLHIFEIFMFICRDCVSQNKVISPISILFITSLHDVIEKFDWAHIKEKYSENATFTSLEACLDIMASPSHHTLKYMANGILKGLIPLMIDADKCIGEKSNATSSEESTSNETPSKLSVHLIEPTLIHMQSLIDAILNPHKVGEKNCILLPHTDGHSVTLGYLLLWEVLLDIAQESTAYLQHEYSEFFKNGQYVEQLLDALFRLIPGELSGQYTSQLGGYFQDIPILSYKDSITWELVGHLACHRLLRCLQGGWLGVFVRGWWGSLPSRSSQYVERIVQTHVSPLLISAQLINVAKKQTNLPNIEINIHNSVNEVVCIYTIEDLKMGLVIQLCKNHPLNKPRVISSGTPINNMTWLSMYLSHQNGSVYQAIKMWANAVQKKVESTPVCYVCYCRLHPTTGQLPKMLCQTCKNKFHNVCLYRWFNTSGKTTCPMCRNLFNV